MIRVYEKRLTYLKDPIEKSKVLAGLASLYEGPQDDKNKSFELLIDSIKINPGSPVNQSGNVLDSLCTSCHSKGNIAQKKIPRISSHPTDRLIINTVLNDKSLGLYTPMFNNNGKMVDVGNISCPTCHNTHRWGYLNTGMHAAAKPRGIGASKFLRTTSSKTVCVNCHAEETPFRYLYFHQPERRNLPAD